MGWLAVTSGLSGARDQRPVWLGCLGTLVVSASLAAVLTGVTGAVSGVVQESVVGLLAVMATA